MQIDLDPQALQSKGLSAQTVALDAQRLLLDVQSTRMQIAVDTVSAIGVGVAT